MPVSKIKNKINPSKLSERILIFKINIESVQNGTISICEVSRKIITCD